MVVNLYEYHKIPYGIDYGVKFKPSGTTHILLFDCSVAQGSKDSAPETGLNSPILARLKTAVADNHSIQVHVIPSPPSYVFLNIRLYAFLEWFMDFVYGERLSPAFAFTLDKPHLKRQMWDGYRRLVNTYKLNNKLKIRDKVLLFGDGDGVYAANAVALMIRRVGLLQDLQQHIKGIFTLLYDVAAYDSCEQASRNSFRVLRSVFARVDLLSLCIDTASKEHLNPIEEDKVFVAKVLEFSRSPCVTCSGEVSTSCSTGCPVRHMIEAAQAELVTSFDEEIVAGPVPLSSEPQLQSQAQETKKTEIHPDATSLPTGSEFEDSGYTTTASSRCTAESASTSDSSDCEHASHPTK